MATNGPGEGGAPLSLQTTPQGMYGTVSESEEPNISGNPTPSVDAGSPGTSSTQIRLGGSNGYPAAYWNPPVAVGSYPYLPVPAASPPPAPVGSLGTSHDINTPISAVPLADASVQSDEGSSDANIPLPQGSGTLNEAVETDSSYNTSAEVIDGIPQEASGSSNSSSTINPITPMAAVQELTGTMTGSGTQIVPQAARVSSREIGNSETEIEGIIAESSTAGAARERSDPYSRRPGSPSAIGPDERFMENLDDQTPTVGEGFTAWNSTDGDNGSLTRHQTGKRVRIRRSIASGMQAVREEFEALRANLANLGTTTKPRDQVETGERRRTSSSMFKSISDRKGKSRAENSETMTDGVELSTMKGKKPLGVPETGFVVIGGAHVPQGQENETPKPAQEYDENHMRGAAPGASTAGCDSGDAADQTGSREPVRQDYLDDIFGSATGYARRVGFFSRLSHRRTRSETAQNPMPLGRMDGTNDAPERGGVSRSLATFGKNAGRKVKKIVGDGVATLRGKKGDYVEDEGVLGEEIPMESAPPMTGALMSGMQSEAFDGAQDIEHAEGQTTEEGEGRERKGFMKSVREWRSARRRPVHSFF